MANVAESATWEDGVYQIETTDPVMGGADGISNRQAQQLANRTKYLKERSDQIDEAKGAFGSLDERLDQYDAFSPDQQNAAYAIALAALQKAGLGLRELDRLHTVKTQRGFVRIANRGVVQGCVVTKSSTATRNFSLSAGLCFYGSRLLPTNEAQNAAAIPSNLTDADGYCYCYLLVDGVEMRMVATEVGGSVPDKGLPLYRALVPSGNTAENDPQGNSVVLTDMRRIEANWPKLFTTAPYALVALSYPFLDADYSVSLDVEDFAGGGFQEGKVYVGDRAANGFKIYLNGTIDSVSVRWSVHKKEV